MRRQWTAAGGLLAAAAAAVTGALPAAAAAAPAAEAPVAAAVGAATTTAAGAVVGTAAHRAPATSLATLREGSRGSLVRSLQVELGGVAVDGVFGPETRGAVVALQRRYHLATDGVVGRNTWFALSHSRHELPAGMPSAAVRGAREDGYAVVADKSTRVLYLLRWDAPSRRVMLSLQSPTSFGGCNSDGCYDTPTGTFDVDRREGRDYRSGAYDLPNGKGAPMPWSVFFVGGVALHYDPLGASHECVHIPSLTDAKLVHDHMRVGSTVVVRD